jgi:hypothetical protein
MLDDDLLARVPELRTAGAIPEGDRQGAGRAAGHVVITLTVTHYPPKELRGPVQGK